MIYLQLFLSFLKIGLFGFGGGLAIFSLIQHEIEVHGWMTQEEFVDILADESEPEKIRVLMAEALAWFNISVNKELIADTCKRLLEKGGMSEELTREVKRAYSRVTSKK